MAGKADVGLAPTLVLGQSGVLRQRNSCITTAVSLPEREAFWNAERRQYGEKHSSVLYNNTRVEGGGLFTSTRRIRGGEWGFISALICN